MDFLQTDSWNGSCGVFVQRAEVASKIQLLIYINLLIPED